MAFDKIIVLDDEMIIRKTLEAHLRKRRYSVASAASLAEAEALLAKDRFDLVFADVCLPDGKGTELLERFAQDPDAPLFVVVTAFGTIESAVECMRLGALDYVIKPFSTDHIDVLLKKAEEFSRLRQVNQYFSSGQEDEREILGNSPAVAKLRQITRKVAQTEATVLISGENGTGKELVAHNLYRQSALASQPYIRVNCAAIADQLIESEFFGHEKGAFTGATERREGRFELAHNGTILLDEISEIPMRLQAKLLRVLQEQEFERVGGNKTIKVKVRVLATTNRNLVQAVERGEFREDLYYRLNVFPLQVPPLRERGEDVLFLADSFLQRFSRKHGVAIPGFTDRARESMLLHPWPGNVRELQNCIERAVILSNGGEPLDAPLLGLAPSRPWAPRTVVPQPEHLVQGAEEPMDLDEVERRYLLRVLHTCGGNRTAAADQLQISIRTLRNKLNQYRTEGIAVP